MPTYTAPIQDMKFLLNEVLDIEQYSALPRFENAPKDLADDILEAASKFASGVLQPLNMVGDIEGCTRHDDGSVGTPTGFKDAFDQFVENGWPLLGADQEYGGMDLPQVLGIVVSEMMSTANMSFAMYPGLTRGAVEAITAGGTPEQKAKYLPKMSSCEWGGTMNLTESHCGTDLGLLKSKAVPQADGSYKITGEKIFISSGEHDLTDNIIHMVLARIEGAPAGTKGISLFIVPKVMVNDDGSLGERNSMICSSIEHKMGIHGNSTCTLNFDAATGYLIGEENKGLRLMFIMMNAARLGTGMQGLCQAEAAYQNALEYAKDRLQGRSLTGPKNPDGVADPIIVHPDVRRMLLEQKAFAEGARAFLYWLSLHNTLEDVATDEAVKEKAGDYMALLTPVAKAYVTDGGYKSATNAQQIFGGHGYIEETGASQFVRDARIAMIYEGANGVQALDLVGRKLALHGGRPLFSFIAELDAFIADNAGDKQLDPFLDGLKEARENLNEATTWLMENGLSNFDNAGAGSFDFLQLLGLTSMAYMWAKMAKAALVKSGSDDPFYANKLLTGKFFLARILPDAAMHLTKIKSGAEPLMAMSADGF
ncbi:MAG: acyl-CoA dehydrogenase C-terminal domain-containing protein [Robiginitomaculum sp.]|nr:acyl-CoA dehydrogenase C-terminal domain-containing protein [Robiginitomaculum sp.]